MQAEKLKSAATATMIRFTSLNTDRLIIRQKGMVPPELVTVKRIQEVASFILKAIKPINWVLINGGIIYGGCLRELVYHCHQFDDNSEESIDKIAQLMDTYFKVNDIDMWLPTTVIGNKLAEFWKLFAYPSDIESSYQYIDNWNGSKMKVIKDNAATDLTPKNVYDHNNNNNTRFWAIEQKTTGYIYSIYQSEKFRNETLDFTVNSLVLSMDASMRTVIKSIYENPETGLQPLPIETVISHITTRDLNLVEQESPHLRAYKILLRAAKMFGRGWQPLLQQSKLTILRVFASSYDNANLSAAEVALRKFKKDNGRSMNSSAAKNLLHAAKLFKVKTIRNSDKDESVTFGTEEITLSTNVGNTELASLFLFCDPTLSYVDTIFSKECQLFHLLQLLSNDKDKSKVLLLYNKIKEKSEWLVATKKRQKEPMPDSVKNALTFILLEKTTRVLIKDLWSDMVTYVDDKTIDTIFESGLIDDDEEFVLFFAKESYVCHKLTFAISDNQRKKRYAKLFIKFLGQGGHHSKSDSFIEPLILHSHFRIIMYLFPNGTDKVTTLWTKIDWNSTYLLSFGPKVLLWLLSKCEIAKQMSFTSVSFSGLPNKENDDDKVAIKSLDYLVEKEHHIIKRLCDAKKLSGRDIYHCYISGGISEPQLQKCINNNVKVVEPYYSKLAGFTEGGSFANTKRVKIIQQKMKEWYNRRLLQKDKHDDATMQISEIAL